MLLRNKDMGKNILKSVKERKINNFKEATTKLTFVITAEVRVQ